MEIRPVGASALLIDLGGDVDRGGDAAGPAMVEAWRAALWRRRAAGDFIAIDIVPGARTILVDGVADQAGLAASLPDWAPSGGEASAPGPIIEIPTWYDGPDVPVVARHWGVSEEAVVARHQATEFHVAFGGFAPGFAYLTGLPSALAVPRLDTPRTRVPAGSVALADTYCGIYPTASPGGWLLIGRTDVVLFDPERDPPALLAPGVRVRFVPAVT
jgi:KipI family sensor histidine kinase inhibitor